MRSPFSMHTLRSLAAVGVGLASASVASAQSLVVPGSANPNLAGRPNGYVCCGGPGVSPDQSPAQSPPSVSVAGGSWYTFAVSGVSYYGTPGSLSANNPDGNEAGSLTNYGDGISAPLNVRYNALYGVFLTGSSPSGTLTPPRLDFSGGLNFNTLSPGIGQIFFIGDGLTSDSNNPNAPVGTRQQFLAPTNATRLFFGTGDGFGWSNNSGQFNVTVNTVNAVPEPSSALLLTAGFVVLGAAHRRRAVKMRTV